MIYLEFGPFFFWGQFSITQCVPFPILFRSTGTGGPPLMSIPDTPQEHVATTRAGHPWIHQIDALKEYQNPFYMSWDDAYETSILLKICSAFLLFFFFHIFSQSLRYWGIEEWVDSFEPNHSHMLNGAGRFTNICPKITHFVGKYTIHGAYGTWRRNEEMWRVPLLSTSISGRPARRSGAAASKSSKSSESSESSAAGGTGPGTERGRRGRGRSRKNWRWSPLEMMSLTQKCGLKHSTDVWIWENVEVEQ